METQHRRVEDVELAAFVDFSEAEIACFEGAMDGMGKGWSAGMALLEELLVDLQS